MSRKKLIISVICILIIIFCGLILKNEYDVPYYPKEQPLNLSSIKVAMNNHKLSDSDYSLISSQTGIIDRQAIDSVLAQNEGYQRLLTFQKNYFRKPRIYSSSMNIVTFQEFTIDAYGNDTKYFDIAPYKNGYVLVTKSVSTLGWKHGHCGIIIDAQKSIVLESLAPGSVSIEQDIDKWKYYPTFKMLKLKNANEYKLNEIARYAQNTLSGLKYNIFAKKNSDNTPKSLNCAQIIWEAFIHFNYDIDSDKGPIVTPEDISKSDLFETVQVYGFRPDSTW